MSGNARFLPAPIERLAGPYAPLLAEFLRFGAVGLVGFVVDTAVVYALRAEMGLYVAGLFSYVAAATTTWALNRQWTFRGRSSHPAHRQWALFLGANMAGFLLNRGAYAGLIATTPVFAAYPVLAVFAGAVSGMLVNFVLSRRLVFR